MEFPEDPLGEPRSEAHSPQAPDGETEAWLRRELAFLHGVERRIVRRSRMRREAWRAAAVALIMAVFACCWYLAALSDNSSSKACPTVASTAKASSGAKASAADAGSSTGAPGVTGHAHEGASAQSTASGCAA